jgi:hypothetical protein
MPMVTDEFVDPTTGSFDGKGETVLVGVDTTSVTTAGTVAVVLITVVIDLFVFGGPATSVCCCPSSA